MHQSMPFRQSAGAQLVRNRLLAHALMMRGMWEVEHWRAGRLLNIYRFLNDIVNQGKNDLLSVYFNSGTATPSTSWYIGLISNTSYTGLGAGDTAASHAGWTEFTAYTEANRVAWGPAAPASQSITNTTPDQFDVNGAGTVKGVFVITDSTKGGTGGKLWATALFTADVPVNSGDQLKTTYTLSC